MVYSFLIAVIIIVFLVFAMFMILRNTVHKINNQTKSYFVDKLQDYNHLIDDKEDKLKKIDEDIKKRELELNKEYKHANKDNYEFDYNIIDLFSKVTYQDNNIYELTKKIDKKFNIDYDKLLKNFISNTKASDTIYNFCIKLKEKFTSEVIYKAKLLSNYDNYLKELLDDNEYRIYEVFKETSKKKNIENFMIYIDELIDLNNPTIIVYVGSKDENYNHLSKYIKTEYTSSIYKGIKIIYKNKLYDFSLSERNA